MFAEELCRVQKDSIKTVGRRKNLGKGRSGPWWTQQCKAAKLKYRNATTEAERTYQAKKFRAAMTATKRECWNFQIETTDPRSGTYKGMRWRTPKFIGKPLRYNGQLVLDQAKRAIIL